MIIHDLLHSVIHVIWGNALDSLLTNFKKRTFLFQVLEKTLLKRVATKNFVFLHRMSLNGIPP